MFVEIIGCRTTNQLSQNCESVLQLKHFDYFFRHIRRITFSVHTNTLAHTRTWFDIRVSFSLLFYVM